MRREDGPQGRLSLAAAGCGQLDPLRAWNRLNAAAGRARPRGGRGHLRKAPVGPFEGEGAQRPSKSPEERQRRVGEGTTRPSASECHVGSEGLSAVPTTEQVDQERSEWDTQ